MASMEMQKFLSSFAAGQDKGKHLPIEDQRRNFDAFMTHLQVPEGILIDDYTLAGRPARKYFTPGVREDATLLYFHGGGHLSGSLNSHHSFTAHLAIACGTAVNALDYRLAPEHPYPAAVDDAVAAYSEMLQYTPGEHIVLAGDSAGGNLALACFLRIKREGLPMPGCGILLSPVTDWTGQNISSAEMRAHSKKNAGLYVGDWPLDTPEISPLYGDLSGLPPLLVQYAKDEGLEKDSTIFEIRAREAGVHIELREFDEAFHVFQIFTNLPESHEALAEIGAFYRKHI